MPEVWNPSLSQELQRAFDLTQAVYAQGVAAVSPIFLIGPGADAAISTVHRYNVSAGFTANAGVTGGVGVSLLASEQRVVIIRQVVVSSSAAQQFKALLLNAGAGVGYPPGTALTTPRNKRNDSLNIGPTMGFSTGTTTPGAGDIVGLLDVPALQGIEWVTQRDTVLVADTALVIVPINLASTFAVDINFDVYQPQSK